MDEYQVKLEILEEWRKALRCERLYCDLVELNSGLLDEILSYYKSQGLKVPNPQKVNRLMQKLVEIVDIRVAATSPALKRPQASPDNENGIGTLDSNEFSRGQSRSVERVMAQKARIAKEIGDKEFDERMDRVLAQDRQLLEKLALV